MIYGTKNMARMEYKLVGARPNGEMVQVWLQLGLARDERQTTVSAVMFALEQVQAAFLAMQKEHCTIIGFEIKEPKEEK